MFIAGLAEVKLVGACENCNPKASVWSHTTPDTQQIEIQFLSEMVVVEVTDPLRRGRNPNLYGVAQTSVAAS